MERLNVRLWRSSRYIALLLILTLSLSACDPFGDDDDDMGDASGPPMATETPAGDDQATEPADDEDADASPTPEGEDDEASPTAPDGDEEATPEETADLSAMPDGQFGFGNEAGEDRIAEWNIDVAPNGEGLPDGSGTAADGEAVYNAECARCHGAEGQGGDIGPQLIAEGDVWEPGEPRTVDNYWPYATTIWDYTNRAMPFDNPGSLEPDQVYAVTAYQLYLGGIIGENDEMNAETLPQVEMPNLENFNIQCWPDQCLPEAQR